MSRRVIAGVVALAVLIGLGFAGRAALFAWIFTRIEPAPMAPVTPIEPFADHAAVTCSACHVEIYREWSGARMGQAMTEPLFVADFEAQGRPFACLRCHAPLDAQRPVRVTGLSSLQPLVGHGAPNARFDASLQREGVTCVVCHLQRGAMVGPFDDARSPPHAVRADAAALRGRCERCHQLAPPPLTGLNRPLPDTHGEWRAWQAATGRTEHCIDCHMPALEGEVAVGGGIRPRRSHRFPGGWSDDMVRKAVAVSQVERVGDEIRVTLRNETGHNLPTAEPARAIVVTAGDQEVVIARRVLLPRLKDAWDTSLGPAETRTVSLKVGPEPVEVVVWFDRLRFPPSDAQRPGVENRRVQIHRVVR